MRWAYYIAQKNGWIVENVSFLCVGISAYSLKCVSIWSSIHNTPLHMLKWPEVGLVSAWYMAYGSHVGIWIYLVYVLKVCVSYMAGWQIIFGLA